MLTNTYCDHHKAFNYFTGFSGHRADFIQHGRVRLRLLLIFYPLFLLFLLFSLNSVLGASPYLNSVETFKGLHSLTPILLFLLVRSPYVRWDNG